MIAAKDNPFAMGRVHALGYQPQELSWESIDARLEQLNFTAAITGPHGSGKTTLLEHLETRLADKGIETQKLFVSNDVKLPRRTIHQTILSMPHGGVLLFDGACHLSRWRWRQVKQLAAKRNIGLIITSHDEGMLATLMRCETNPALLSNLVDQLTENQPPFTEQTLTELYHTHRGNLRDCLRQLYDDYAISAVPSN